MVPGSAVLRPKLVAELACGSDGEFDGAGAGDDDLQGLLRGHEGSSGEDRFGDGLARKKKRTCKPLQVDGRDVPQDAWKRFTPDVVRTDLCLARVWNSGRGGECSRRALGGNVRVAQR